MALRRMITRLIGTAGIALFACAQASYAAPTQWKLADGGNGHVYEVIVPGFVTPWEAARSAAQLKASYLATITSATEQSFVEQLLISNDAPTGSYWLGGVQNEPGHTPHPTFRWITAEPFAYTHWDPVGEEPNGDGDAPRIALIWSQTPEVDRFDRRGGWDDEFAAGLQHTQNPDVNQRGFIIERLGPGVVDSGGGGPGPVAVPLPDSLAMALVTLLTGATAVGIRRGMLRRPFAA